MCIFSIVYRVVPECPVFVLTNRDESTERSSLLPQIFTAGENGTQWFGGADARAGGTWFGVNEYGLLAAVTNRRKDLLPPKPRSRGLLCRDVLGLSSAADAVEWVLREVSDRAYAGFNLVIVTSVAAWVIEAVDGVRATQLEPGVHSVSNSPFGAHDDARVNLAQGLVERMVREEPHWTGYVERAKEICSIHSIDNSPGMCLHGETWGTVGSTIVALAEGPSESQYVYSPGPPCRTPYVDDSSAFKTFLSEKTA